MPAAKSRRANGVASEAAAGRRERKRKRSPAGKSRKRRSGSSPPSAPLWRSFEFLHLLRGLDAEAVQCILQDDPGGVDEIDPGLPQRGRFRREDGEVAVEEVELGREVRSEGRDRVHPPPLCGLPQGRGELRDPTEEALLLGMLEEARVSGCI